MMGSFAGTEVTGDGDTVSMTGKASGLVPAGSTFQAVSPDFINNTPAADPSNVGVSLPSSCTGNPACVFMATSLRKGFSTQISEIVQQQCGTNADGVAVTACQTQLETRVKIILKRDGNRIALPLEHRTHNEDPNHPEINPTEELAQGLAPQFGSLEVSQLSIFPNQFSMTANVILNAGDTIDPTTEEVFLRVGDYSTSILPGGFKRLGNGRLFKFTGKIDGREVVVSFSRETDTLWKFVAEVHQIQLTGVPQAPLQVPVEIGIGSDIGQDLVTARFFGK